MWGAVIHSRPIPAVGSKGTGARALGSREPESRQPAETERVERERRSAEERARIRAEQESEEGRQMVEAAIAQLPWRRVRV